MLPKKFLISSANLKSLDKSIIPNLVTGVRIIAAPVTALAVLNNNFWLACLGVGIASFSDWFDGFIARRMNTSSPLGEILDPLADKIFIALLVVALLYKQLIPFWFVLTVLTRDLAIIFCGLYARWRSIPINLSPIFMSKLNTALQLAVVCCAILQTLSTFSGIMALMYSMLIYVTFLTTLLSGYLYAQRFIQACQ
jgi:cardiolipin synthase